MQPGLPSARVGSRSRLPLPVACNPAFADAVTEDEMASAAEQVAMQRAIALSVAGLGSTNPNPSVGAVVLDRDAAIVGEGATQPVGGDHAEIVALAAAGDRARGATLVVTLEPCRHTGRTGPCTAAIVAAGIARVVYAVDDPHAVAGGGGAELRDQGLDVEAGLLAETAARGIEGWLSAAARGRPYVTWKYAATLDGHTTAADGTSQWITGDAARADVHRERSLVDAVVVGIGTVLADDPALTVRDWPTARQPLRVVVDAAARTPIASRVVDATAPTLLAVAADADEQRVATLRANGVDVVALPCHDGLVDLGELLAALFEREVRIILLEGGATLAASFVREHLVDRVVAYYAPKLLGAGAPVIGDIGVATLAGAQHFSVDDVGVVGDDIRVVAHGCQASGEGRVG
jgi:diaminohydroxyphosphoribosylaminopyrimidine deaminase/5-amino-6-(5-phosphoribosylamino)uracil reductase